MKQLIISRNFFTFIGDYSGLLEVFEKLQRELQQLASVIASPEHSPYFIEGVFDACKNNTNAFSQMCASLPLNQQKALIDKLFDPTNSRIAIRLFSNKVSLELFLFFVRCKEAQNYFLSSLIENQSILKNVFKDLQANLKNPTFRKKYAAILPALKQAAQEQRSREENATSLKKRPIEQPSTGDEAGNQITKRRQVEIPQQSSEQRLSSSPQIQTFVIDESDDAASVQPSELDDSTEFMQGDVRTVDEDVSYGSEPVFDNEVVAISPFVRPEKIASTIDEVRQQFDHILKQIISQNNPLEFAEIIEQIILLHNKDIRIKRTPFNTKNIAKLRLKLGTLLEPFHPKLRYLGFFDERFVDIIIGYENTLSASINRTQDMIGAYYKFTLDAIYTYIDRLSIEYNDQALAILNDILHNITNRPTFSKSFP